MFVSSGLCLTAIVLVSGCQILDVPPGLTADRTGLSRPASLKAKSESASKTEENAPNASADLPPVARATPETNASQGESPVIPASAKAEKPVSAPIVQAIAKTPLFSLKAPSQDIQAGRPAAEAIVLANAKSAPMEGVRSRKEIEHATRGMLVALTPADPPLPTFNGASESDPLLAVYRRGYTWFQETDSFTCRMVRREVVSGKQHPEELMAFQYKKNPYSIHFKWLGQEGKGREVVYVEGKFDDKIQTRLAAGDIPFMPAGKRMSFAVDNPLVRSASRHSVREASFGFMLSTVGTMLALQKEGNSKLGSIQYVGKIRRPDLGGEVEMVECKLAPGAEHTLPEGGRRLYAFDPVVGHPVLVQTFDSHGQEVEYYRYDRFFFKGLEDSDFDPETLWAKPDVAAKQS